MSEKKKPAKKRSVTNESFEFLGVQPAPAEEKKRGFENCVIKMREGEHLDLAAPYFNGYTIRPNEECGVTDRRKGERRSGSEWTADGFYTRWMLHDNETWHTGHTDSAKDRRSGTDRRKP